MFYMDEGQQNVPKKNNLTDAGYDVQTQKEIILEPKGRKTIDIGINIKNDDVIVKIGSRSGLAAKGIYCSGRMENGRIMI